MNECDTRIDAFYYHIDYEVYPKTLDDVGYFHAKWHREVTKPSGKKVNIGGEDNYLILYAEGRGHYIGCILSVNGLRPGWWGEGDDMIFVDGERWPPSLHGTGTEDYIGAAWGFNREFYGPFHGFPLKGPRDWTGYHSMYRFHLEAPIPFKKSIKVTIEHGHANDRGDEWSSVAYWYQTEPHIEFLEMPKAEDRIPLPPKTPEEVLKDIINDIKSDEKLLENYWRYVWMLNEVLSRISEEKGYWFVSRVNSVLWRKLYEEAKEKEEVEKIRKILLEAYNSLIGGL